MDTLDNQIKNYLDRKAASITQRGRFEEAPSAEDFYQFINDTLKGDALEKMLRYLRDNPEAQTFVAQTRKFMTEGEASHRANPPREWLENAKNLLAKPLDIQCPYCRKSLTPFQKPIKQQNLTNILTLTLSIIFFLGSFMYRRYFFQCLVIALFFGIKWVVDQKSTKTQILIYKALKDDEHHTHSRDLHNTESHL